jgi:NADH dehydrogenase
VLFNTYWVRFNHARFSHEQAVRNSAILFDCARRAGVRRVVHVSITNPDLDSPLSYFRGKALVEQALHESGLSHAILRPAVLFGRQDILINNIAWTLRRFPLVAIPGDGQYRLQPIHVDDLATLAADSAERGGNSVINAIGPETFTYRELVGKIGEIIGSPRRLLSLPPALVYSAGATIGAWMRDVFITRDEIRGLMAGLLCVDAAPAGGTFLTAWARERAAELGRSYASELGRRRAVRA